jgi:GNAT superfamily N-acetyltransferase
VIGFRSALPRDRPFLVSAWSASLRKSDYAGMISDDDWADVMRPQIERVLDTAGMQVVVAHETEATPGIADLLGFIAANVGRMPSMVAYVYVKSAYRRAGLARKLFRAIGVDPKLPFDYVCRTVMVDELERHIPHATFRPVLARKAVT